MRWAWMETSSAETAFVCDDEFRSTASAGRWDAWRGAAELCGYFFWKRGDSPTFSIVRARVWNFRRAGFRVRMEASASGQKRSMRGLSEA